MVSMESSASQNGSSGPPPQKVLIHVLSPSIEVPRLTFREVPISTTIGDIKKRIQDAVSIKPPPERQRLIYRGKVLTRHEMTLEAVLGLVAVRHMYYHAYYANFDLRLRARVK